MFMLLVALLLFTYVHVKLLHVICGIHLSSSGMHSFQQRIPQFIQFPAPAMHPAGQIRDHFSDTNQQQERYSQPHQYPPPSQQCTPRPQSYLPLQGGQFGGASQGMYVQYCSVLLATKLMRVFVMWICILT